MRGSRRSLPSSGWSPGLRFEGAHRDERDAEVAHLREQTVQLGLIRDDTSQGGGAVVLAAQRETVEPVRPVVVELGTHTYFVDGWLARLRPAVHDAPANAPARFARRAAGRTMNHSATARLRAQAPAIIRSVRATPVPKIASPKPTVNAWVPAPSARA